VVVVVLPPPQANMKATSKNADREGMRKILMCRGQLSATKAISDGRIVSFKKL
jgi:hypothetical protein